MDRSLEVELPELVLLVKHWTKECGLVVLLVVASMNEETERKRKERMVRSPSIVGATSLFPWLGWG